MCLAFLMEKNIFLQEYFKIIWYLYQLKNTLNILVALLELIRGNLMEFQKQILFASTFVDHYVLPDINFNGHSLINNNISIRKKVINIYIYISYILNQWPRDFNTDFTLGSCLFGSVKLTKNADLDKYKYRCWI